MSGAVKESVALARKTSPRVSSRENVAESSCQCCASRDSALAGRLGDILEYGESGTRLPSQCHTFLPLPRLRGPQSHVL